MVAEWRQNVRRVLSALIEHCSRAEISFLCVPLLQFAWKVPVEHFECPLTVRDLFVRYPDDIESYRPLDQRDVLCAPCDGLARAIDSRQTHVKRGVDVDD